jgi:hypothetical protein
MWRKLAFHNPILDKGVDSVINKRLGYINHDTGFIEPPDQAMNLQSNWLFFGYQSMLRDCWLWHQIWFTNFNSFVCTFCKLRCYKVVVKVRNFQETVQFFQLMQAAPMIRGELCTLPGKVGIDERDYSSGPYNGFIYCDGLEDARHRYSIVRELVDNHMEDGENIDIIIKRSCTEFERIHGATDQPYWQDMKPEELDFERKLMDIFKGQWTCAVQPDWLKNRIVHRFARWANSIGDHTWADYFGEDFLTMKAVTYHQLPEKGDQK